MRILCTGSAGYIGSHFVNRVKGHEILVVDNFSQGENNIIDGIEYDEVDIRDKENLILSFKDFKPDVVVHFAATANVQNALTRPVDYYDNNVIGTFNVLECMREVGCNKIIFSSTAAVYKPSNTPLWEGSPKEPVTAYGFTKLVNEEMLKDYYKAYGINSISFRYFCASGCDKDLKVGCYHDPETQVIPNIVKTLLGKQQVFNVWGNDFKTPDGTGVRDYVHVDDIADAHILAMENITGCEIYNLGINQGYSVLELIKKAEELTGKKLNYKISPRRGADPAKLVADCSKVNKELGWNPKNGIDEMIMTDYNFFKTL